MERWRRKRLRNIRSHWLRERISRGLTSLVAEEMGLAGNSIRCWQLTWGCSNRRIRARPTAQNRAQGQRTSGGLALIAKSFAFGARIPLP